MKVKKFKVTAKKSRIDFSECHNILCKKTCAERILKQINFPQLIFFYSAQNFRLGRVGIAKNQKKNKKIVKKTIMFILMAIKFSCKVNWR